ncbi:DUF7848 domain-containing protein [Saccharothrix sp. ST-888]|uniref:DUF7848 domain-containing protein n=1 Tax=Saccharothrix sp. ST-888 TaxID=1427391 RepID=UPI000AAF882D
MYRCLGEDENGKPCGAEGPVCDDFETAQRWPFDHIESKQEHRSYVHAAVPQSGPTPSPEPLGAVRHGRTP